MTTAVHAGSASTRAADGGGGGGGGGGPARRAVVRWAWRLFRREWRQQLLVLALIVVAVGATVVGAAVATDTPPSPSSGFGTAAYRATLSGADPQLASDVANLEKRYGRVDVIADQTLTIPGSVDTFELRAQNPRGPYGQPMLSLVTGHYPNGPGQVALTQGLASAYDTGVGDLWREGGTSRRVVGIVENPQSLLDEFALVVPGQVKAPTQVTVLFDASGGLPGALSPNIQAARDASSTNGLNPETLLLAGLTLGMLLIALVAVGGFTVLAQRRLRSLGLLASLGATDRDVGLVVRANGAVVGVVGAVLGLAVGLVAWLAYRPHLESSAHHLIGMIDLPWLVVVLAMVLAVVAAYLAATRPARSIVRVPIVAALSGRPEPPRQVHRTAGPGIVFLVVAFFLLGYSGSTGGGTGGGGGPELVLGLVALVPAVILLAPFCLSLLARLGEHAPIALRLALRDLARYRARSGSALSAISLGVMIAVIIAILAAARYGNSLDYAGPNLASNQLIVYAPGGNPNAPPPGVGPKVGGLGGTVSGTAPKPFASSAQVIAASLDAPGVVELDSTTAAINNTSPGRNWHGLIYVGTPSLLRAFGIPASSIDPSADILTMRPGISTLSGIELTYGGGGQLPVGAGPRSGPGPKPPPGPASPAPCTPHNDCLAQPVVQEVGALPSGTSAPNTVITEHAIRTLGLATTPAGWLIQTSRSLTAAQIDNARREAASAGLSIETKDDQPTSPEVINWATVFGIALALAVLAMSVGLIRSETASDLRALAAAGASSYTRRTLTAATAGALGLLGALLGTVSGYVGVIGWLRQNSLNGGISALGHVPLGNLAVIVVGMPVAAFVVGWLVAGREPPAIAHQPMS